MCGGLHLRRFEMYYYIMAQAFLWVIQTSRRHIEELGKDSAHFLSSSLYALSRCTIQYSDLYYNHLVNIRYANYSSFSRLPNV